MKESSIRIAKVTDIPIILEFIKGLARYENLTDEVSATEELLKEALFDRKMAEVIIEEYDSKYAGFALFFHNFSTFLGKPGIYLEDLYVKPEFRGKGLGKNLLSYLAKLAIERDCGRLEWACLDWNEPSIKFYKSMGALPMQEWTTYRLCDEKLNKLSEET